MIISCRARATEQAEPTQIPRLEQPENRSICGSSIDRYSASDADTFCSFGTGLGGLHFSLAVPYYSAPSRSRLSLKAVFRRRNATSLGFVLRTSGPFALRAVTKNNTESES